MFGALPRMAREFSDLDAYPPDGTRFRIMALRTPLSYIPSFQPYFRSSSIRRRLPIFRFSTLDRCDLEYGVPMVF